MSVSHGTERRRRGARLIPGLVLWISQRAALEGPLAAVPDLSGTGHNFIVSGVASQQPVGAPMTMEFGAQPCFRLNGGLVQYTQYGGAIADLPNMHRDDFTLLIRFTHHQHAGVGALFATWGGASSNENAYSMEINVSEFLQVFITSIPGVVNLSHATAAGTVRSGDQITVVHRRQGATSRLYVRREPRYPGENGNQPTIIASVQAIGGVVNAGAEVAVPTCGAYRGLATGLLSAWVRDLQLWNRSISDAELERAVSYTRTPVNFPFITYVASRPLLIQAGGDLGAIAGGGADNLHPNDSGQSKVGLCIADLVLALAARLGIVGGVRNRGQFGDSRMTGSNASANANTARAVAGNALLAAPFTDAQSGPEVTQGGAHFAVSGAVTRTLPASTGLSYRTPGPKTFDRYFGVAPPGGDFNTMQWMIGWIGLNEVNRPLVEFLTWDNLYEVYLLFLFVQQNVLAQTGITLGIGVVNEPSIAFTATGPAQREMFARNRGYHMLIQKLQAQGHAAFLANVHDDSYNA